MAIRYAVANGSWSNTAIWDGGTLPTASDDVYSNNFTVTINQNITVISINNTAASPAIAGGGFVVNQNNFTITGNLNYSTISLLLSAQQTGILNIIGNITAQVFTGFQVGVQLTTSGIVNITGNIIAGNGTSQHAVINDFNGIVNVTGNVNGGAGTNSRGIVTSNTGNVTVTGIVTGGIGGNCFGILNSGLSSFTLNGIAISSNSIAVSLAGGTNIINGNQTAAGVGNIYAIASNGITTINGDVLGSLSSSPSNAFVITHGTGILNINGSVLQRSVGFSATLGIVNNSTNGIINISQNVSGGSVANSIAISNGSTGTINVMGNITGGSHATNTPAIYSTTAGTIDVTGSCSADAYPALFSTSITAINRLRGNVLTKNGIVAAYVWKLNISPTAAQQFTFQDTANANRLIATSNISPGAPSVTDVRFGTTYGSSLEYTGTLRVPNPNTVSLGVLTDNTTGTMLMTPADFWNAATSGMTTAGSIGERLKTASTVQTNGDQLAAYIV